MRRAALAAAALAVALALAWWGSGRWSERALRAAGPHATELRLTVPAGATVRGVLTELETRGALHDARAVELALRAGGRSVSVKAGEYLIAPRASAADILEQLTAGRVVLEQLTIVEGWTFMQLRRALENHPKVRATLRGLDDAGVMRALGAPGEHWEGRFNPDTYRFAAGTTDQEILTMAYHAMQKILATEWQQRADGLPLHTPYEALTLASVVEKETGLASERARIAGVFLQRLQRGMRLQSDPTVIYGLGASYDGDIRSRDLANDTPYNTYTRAGLPPTPIALPGRDALHATLQPEITGEIYFVATGAGDGSHHFSRTLEEHNAAVRRYLARLRRLQP